MTYSLQQAASLPRHAEGLLAIGWTRVVHHDRTETWTSPCTKYLRYSATAARRCQDQIEGREYASWVESHPRSDEVKQAICSQAKTNGCDFIRATYLVYVRLNAEGRLHA